ncbi:hypothetical protein FF098_014705 [Parvularcula flava]|uniref:Uncharacterized protein n=1 Tax=Aquisalinus luteolus TaxID=1566827 RepID=A0A8J3A9E9_9PROT|nr:hypothetical protein [Aquisalinus luteolus]NHK29168.1 hypothetical protein [Aquisalinus luteolus]GGI00098.1 hypothetical protein GCM10011355_27590 [Aquisalinus luteolus]
MPVMTLPYPPKDESLRRGGVLTERYMTWERACQPTARQCQYTPGAVDIVVTLNEANGSTAGRGDAVGLLLEDLGLIDSVKSIRSLKVETGPVCGCLVEVRQAVEGAA